MWDERVAKFNSNNNVRPLNAPFLALSVHINSIFRALKLSD